MYQFEIQVRVRYAETDKMGYVYYGNYSTYFEVARVEMMRNLGINYKDMETEGIIMPVLEQHIKYIRPAHYDDLLTIKTTIPKLPGTRIYFEYETYNETGTLLNKAETTLVFVDMSTGKPCTPPQNFIDLIEQFYK